MHYAIAFKDIMRIVDFLLMLAINIYLKSRGALKEAQILTSHFYKSSGLVILCSHDLIQNTECGFK